MAVIFFDFVLAILDLHVLEAPPCSYRILNKSDFYPWKELNIQLNHLIQSCIDYDKVIYVSHHCQLDELEDLLKLIRERAKTNLSMFSATHGPALQAVLKWSSVINNETGVLYGKHVFKMGEILTELVDRRQITVDICDQFIEILQNKIANDDDTIDFSMPHGCFLNVSYFDGKKENYFLFIFSL
jgi:hypothetical protein